MADNPASPQRRRALIGMGGAALAGATLGALGTAGRAKAGIEDEFAPIVGTWLIRAERPQGALAALIFFFPHGIVQYFAAPQQPTTHPGDPSEALEYQTAAGGQWVRTAFNEYRVALASIDYDARGLPTTTDHTEATFTYDPVADTFRASGLVTERSGAGGTTPGPMFGQATVTRVKVGG
jgi:hypothetical protein